MIGKIWIVLSNAGQLLDERTTTGTYYYLMDDLGSVANVVDSTGAVKNSYRYDPFGNSTSKTEAVSNSWQFASGYLDANTGLYKFGQRYYDPTLGRWTQKDPVAGSIGSVNSTNPYVYANNLPNMLVDPSGAYSAYCLGSVAANIIIGFIAIALTVNTVGVWAVGLISAAGNLAAGASIGTALLAGFGALFGVLVLIAGVAIIALAVYYFLTNVQRDCASS